MSSDIKMSNTAVRIRLYSVWQNSRDFYTLLASTTVRNEAYEIAVEETDIITEDDVWVEVPR